MIATIVDVSLRDVRIYNITELPLDLGFDDKVVAMQNYFRQYTNSSCQLTFDGISLQVSCPVGGEERAMEAFHDAAMDAFNTERALSYQSPDGTWYIRTSDRNVSPHSGPLAQ